MIKDLYIHTLLHILLSTLDPYQGFSVTDF